MKSTSLEQAGRSICAVLLVAFGVAGCGGSTEHEAANASEEAWMSIFDGESLEGWTPKIRGEAFGSDERGTFRVEDGAITVGYDRYDGFSGDFGHLFHDTPYNYYRLRFEYRFFGDQVPGGPGWAWRNSGMMIHSPAGETMGVDQDFPISIEVQLLGGNGTDDRSTANLCTPGTHVVMDSQLETRHCINAASPTFHGDDWVQAEILALGDSLIVHRVVGEDVLSYTHPQIGGGSVDGHDPAYKQDGMLLRGGFFSLQSESHPVQFRNLEILNLEGCMDPSDAAFKEYFVAADPSACTGN